MKKVIRNVIAITLLLGVCFSSINNGVKASNSIETEEYDIYKMFEEFLTDAIRLKDSFNVINGDGEDITCEFLDIYNNSELDEIYNFLLSEDATVGYEVYSEEPTVSNSRAIYEVYNSQYKFAKVITAKNDSTMKEMLYYTLKGSYRYNVSVGKFEQIYTPTVSVEFYPGQLIQTMYQIFQQKV